MPDDLFRLMRRRRSVTDAKVQKTAAATTGARHAVAPSSASSGNSSRATHLAIVVFAERCCPVSASVSAVNWLAFIASLVQSLAWPAGVVALGIVFRRPISIALGRGIRRLRIGPVEAEFDHQIAEVRQELRQEARRDPEPTAAKIPDLDSLVPSNLNRLVDASPEAAVTSAYAQIEARLAELLDEAGAPTHSAAGGPALARLARRHELISDETLSAVEGLSVMRNLAVHSTGGEIGRQRAREYLALADAVLYSLQKKPGS
jgi:hypothetical protein